MTPPTGTPHLPAGMVVVCALSITFGTGRRGIPEGGVTVQEFDLPNGRSR
ncbi:MAG TPA: hypothetical protein VJ717_14235 [Gemmatimonadaceae bacterium]|nr:hypothetical protein [Gemmatimonadaceae bacterium]